MFVLSKVVISSMYHDCIANSASYNHAHMDAAKRWLGCRHWCVS